MSRFHCPGLSEGRTLFGRLTRGAGACVMILALAAGAVSCKAKTEDQLLSEAEAQMKARNILGATLLLQDFLKKYPQSENANLVRFRLAEAYALDKDFEKSRQTLDNIIEIAGGRDNETGLNAATLKLDTYVMEQKFTEALNEALMTSDSLKTIKSSFKGYFQNRVGDLYAMSKNPDKAIEIYRGVIARPDLTSVERINALNGAMATFQANNNPDGVEAFYNDYLAMYPQDPFRTRILVQLGAALTRFGKAEQAEKYLAQADQENNAKFEAAVGLDEKAAILFDLTEGQLARKNLPGAQTVLRRIIEEYPTSKHRPRAIWLLGQTLVEGNSLKEALGAFEQLIVEYPKTSEAYSALMLTQRLKATLANPPTTGTMATDAVTTAPLSGAPASEGAPEAAPAAAPEAAPAESGDAAPATN